MILNVLVYLMTSSSRLHFERFYDGSEILSAVFIFGKEHGRTADVQSTEYRLVVERARQQHQ